LATKSLSWAIWASSSAHHFAPSEGALAFLASALRTGGCGGRHAERHRKQGRPHNQPAEGPFCQREPDCMVANCASACGLE
jgi:hypothetical protein